MRFQIFATFILSLLVLAAQCPSENLEPIPQPETCAPLKAVFIKEGAPEGSADGKSWETAYPTIAMAYAQAKPEIGENGRAIFAVAQGNYGVVATKDWQNINLLGGFAGKQDCATDRQPDLFEKTVLNGGGAPHVLVLDDAKNVTISGFKITSGGNALAKAKPTAAQMKTDEIRDFQGGGLRISKGKGLKIEHLLFENNHAHMGGALALLATEIAIENCRFDQNGANIAGAIYMDTSRVKLVKSHLTKNVAETGHGGAILVRAKAPEIASLSVLNSHFGGNKADRFGGAIMNQLLEATTVAEPNVTVDGDSSFSNNVATEGPAIYNGGGVVDLKLADKAKFKANQGAETVPGLGVSQPKTSTFLANIVLP